MSRRLEWGAAVGIGLIASALGALGAPTPVWVVILVIGVGLLAHALVGGLQQRIETPTDITARSSPEVPNVACSPIPHSTSSDPSVI
jgi:hypothetical protein